MVQQHIVDPARTPESQGWMVVDEVANLPRGNVATKWAIRTSLVAGDSDTDRTTTPEPVSIPYAVPVTVQASGLASIGNNTFADATRKKWSGEEIRQLVELRARRVPYSIISKVGLTLPHRPY